MMRLKIKWGRRGNKRLQLLNKTVKDRDKKGRKEKVRELRREESLIVLRRDRQRKERKVWRRKERKRGDSAQFSCRLQGEIEPVVISANNRPPLSAACIRNTADMDKSHTHTLSFISSLFSHLHSLTPTSCGHIISHTHDFSVSHSRNYLLILLLPAGLRSYN